MCHISDNNHLIAILSKAPGHPLIWHQFLDELAQQLHCDSAALLVTNLIDSDKTRFLFSAHIQKEYQEQYENNLNRLDDFNHFISKNPLSVFYDQNLNEAHGKDVKAGFIPPDKPLYRFGVSIPCNQKNAISLLLSRSVAFNEAEQLRAKQTLQSLIPSLDEAIHAEQRHKIDSQLRHYLGGHFDSYIIVDHRLNIIFSDPIFGIIINQMDCVKSSQNQFCMKNPAIEQRLLALIEANQSASIHNQCHSCQIMMIPISDLKNLYQWECYKDGFILAFTHDKASNPMLDRLMGIYKLSRCEAICAQHFMNNPSIAEIATNTFRSQETVRNHIKHMMQKMNVHSQAELMKKLITLTSL